MIEKLKETITEKGISRNKLALLSGISPSDMYGIFNGTRPLFPNWKRRIAEALEMPEEDLFPEDGDNQ